MKKRGQLTIFMIIALVLVLMLSFWLYIQNYALKKQGEASLRVSANLETDAQALQSYIDVAFDDAIYDSLWVWGKSGGVDITRPDIEAEEFESEGVERTVAYLYKEEIILLGDDESVLQDLRSMIGASFLSKVEPDIFEQKGYDIVSHEVPVVANSTNADATAFVLIPNLKMQKGESGHYFFPMVTSIDVVLSQVLGETRSFLIALRGNSLDPDGDDIHNADLYTPVNSNFRFCAESYYEDGIFRFSLVKVSNGREFRYYEDYQFDFLVDEKMATNCQP